MTMRKLLSRATACLTFGCAAALMGTAIAAELESDWANGHASRARLIGSNGTAGVEVEMSEGWKTYWRTPGDAGGVPPAFDFSKSDNLASAKVLYPAPKRFSDSAGDTVGYKGTVIFPVVVTAKDARKPIDLHLTIDYGVCKEICVPATATLSLALPPKNGSVPAGELAEALTHVPAASDAHRAGDPALKSVHAELTGSKPRIVLNGEFPGGAEHADIFVEAPDGNFIPLPKRIGAGSGDNATFEVDLSDGVDVQQLKGKTLTATLVSGSGQSEATFPLE